MTAGLSQADKVVRIPVRPEERDSHTVAYLRCPECRLTAPATAYYLRGDQCPRCLTPMEPADKFRDTPAHAAAVAAVSRETAANAAQPG
jgi:hypothetical protein